MAGTFSRVSQLLYIDDYTKDSWFGIISENIFVKYGTLSRETSTNN